MADFYAMFSAVSSYQLHLAVTQASQNLAGNYSTDNWAAYVEKLFGSGFWTTTPGNTGSISGDLAGAANGWAPYDFRGYTQKLIGSGAGNVPHAADGTKTAAGSFAAADSAGGNMGSAGSSWALGQTPIPRGALDRWNGTAWPMQMLDRRDATDWDQIQTLERFDVANWVRQQ